MKKRNLLFIAIIALFSSCTNSYWIEAPYTSVEKLANLKAGMNISQVNSTLGIPPYNIYHIQEDGSSVITYNYRIRNRRMAMPSDPIKQKELKATEAAQTQGETWYETESHTVFVFFKDGQMKSMISDEGMKKSEYLLIKDNNLKIISKKEYNSIRKIEDSRNTNLLILDENKQVRSITLPKEKVDESTTIQSENVNLEESKTNILNQNKQQLNDEQKKKNNKALGVVAGTLVGLLLLITIIGVAAS